MAVKILILELFILARLASGSNDGISMIPLSNVQMKIMKIPKVIAIDSVAAKEAEDAFQEALNEELPGLADVKLLTTQQQQGRPVESQAVVAKTGNVAATISDEPEEQVSEFEKDVTKLVLGLSKNGDVGKDGYGATPFGSSVQTILDLIMKDMMPRVNQSHDANQKQLDDLAAAVHACVKTKTIQIGKTVKYQKIYKGTSKVHQTCRATEAGLYTTTLDQWKDMKNKKKIKEIECKSFSAMSKKLGEQNNNKQIVSKGGTEAIETYIRRVTATVCGKPGGKGLGGNGKDGFLDQFLIAKGKCEKKTKQYNEAKKKFIALDKSWHAQKVKCDSLQDAMDTAACKHAVGVKDACESFEECYTSRKKSYDTAAKATITEVTDRKAEWKGLQRMLCLITAFKDGKVEGKEIMACKSQAHNTDHLDIKYPSVPSMETCRVPDLYPYTAAYKTVEFTPLPALAKGKVDANPCNGVAAISTTPAMGSPKSCKCQRVTMNGPFKPGAMVKCDGCLDVRRSQEKNSCPSGTKLFSPSGRTDWDTFLKSASPLRSPNWIVDVTRPQNGCGGCTKHVMNSDTAKQSTWATKDGSPWWLRSSKYNEPNGDYHANCYLDLWHNPKNADSVTYNDNNCKYHSKAYYCQMVKQSLVPKRGSPNGCVCKVVIIASGNSYSPGSLLKCENCLKVYKSNEKNSCPMGTKLFAPKTRLDWKAIISSSTPLRAPHWIIDVTRPQNGCGGCTGHPMNSASAAQATWRTADGSSWWLRSTRYNEPNGDYSANCYLDLWQTPANENSVTWNDGRCLYHSKSYYCQTVKQKATTTTKAPPWKAPQVSTKPKDGSPTSCSCTKLALKGQFSAGAILKCTGCLDVSKTSQKNSCPQGTKIFSPQSRSDWETFFKSGGKPLYAPNWIIDVTRPQNGCGGCTKHSMNSASAGQSTWKTSDGTPWWMRTGAYSEPNGDYTANCYLDLWHSPKSANDIKFNDKKCTYHAKSYYCQLKSV